MQAIRSYLIISATVFALVAAAHLTRALYASPLVFAGWAVPLEVSWLAALVTAALSLWALSLLRKRA